MNYDHCFTTELLSFLWILDQASLQNTLSNWFIILPSDVYVFPDKLANLLTNHSGPIVVGRLQNSDLGSYIAGYSGYFIHRNVLELWNNNFNSIGCQAYLASRFVAEALPDDVMIAECLKQIGATLIDSSKLIPWPFDHTLAGNITGTQLKEWHDTENETLPTVLGSLTINRIKRLHTILYENSTATYDIPRVFTCTPFNLEDSLLEVRLWTVSHLSLIHI
eukprot:TRINITY_DN4500_c0_g1_i11.p1 TRINITY_DN4500_c0_g1~~TRINITY_DN4500_c0_g1_i11.p1  ORF type:complete len:221 (+),score=24.67 TRINITY_DN4500_c0_g1_i11:428-1090(+)